MHLSIRIISGIYKGRRIYGPKNLPVRPTTDFAKEGLFNILSHSASLEGARVLDLYSGTGNIAYEFGSRGAAHIDCVDQNRGCVKFIEQTAQKLNLPIITHAMPVMRFIQKSINPYDIVFADPPYELDKPHLQVIVNQILNHTFSCPKRKLILEHNKERDFETHPRWKHSRKFGSSVFSFFE